MTDKDSVYGIRHQAKSFTNYPWCLINNNNSLDRMSCLSTRQQNDPCIAQRERKCVISTFLYIFVVQKHCIEIYRSTKQLWAPFSLFRKPNFTPTVTHISTTYRKEKRK